MNNIQSSPEKSQFDLPLVSVGIPTYNRPDGLRRTLECITRQTYKNLEIIVSDNCSPSPVTDAVVREFIAKDNRILYYRQDENRGPAFNFPFVLEKATGEFFMWAADDDEWEPDFIKKLIELLMDNPEIGMAFCNFVNIDQTGNICIKYPDYSGLSSLSNYILILKFFFIPEGLGKANLFYSIYRKNFLNEVRSVFHLTNSWGSDNCFILAAIARGGIIIDKQILFKKGTNILLKDNIEYKQLKKAIFPFEETIPYFIGTMNALKHTKYFWIIFLIFPLRILNSFYFYLLKILYSKKGFNIK